MNRNIFMAYIPKGMDSLKFSSYEVRMHQNSYGYETNLYLALRNTGFIDRNIETFGYERDNENASTDYVPCTLDIDSFRVTYSGYPHEFGIYKTDGLFYNQEIANNCKDMAYNPCELDSRRYVKQSETLIFESTDRPSFVERASIGCDVFIPVQTAFLESFPPVLPVEFPVFEIVTLLDVRNPGEFVYTRLFKGSVCKIGVYFGKVSFNYLSGDLYIDTLSEQDGQYGIMTGNIEAVCNFKFTINRYTV